MNGFKNLGVTAPEFVNTVREVLPEPYRSNLPIAKAGQKDFSAIGDVLAEDDHFASLWHKNAIKMVMKILQRDNKIVNPLSEFEGELITSGEYIEDMILDIAETFQFDPSAAGLDRYVIQVTQSMLSGNEQEKYYETKALISTAIRKGLMRVIDLGNKVTSKDLQKAILRHSKRMVHPGRFYNMGNVGQPNNMGRTGISIQADRQELRMLLPVDTSVDLNVDFFASAFQLDAVQSGLAIKEVDAFPSIYEYTKDHKITDIDMASGFFNDFNYKVGDVVPKGAQAKPEAYEYAKENGLDDIELVFDASRIQAVILDRRALVINPMLETTLASQPNSLGRYVQIILQDKELFSYSPFMPACVIMSDAPDDCNSQCEKKVKDVTVDGKSVVGENGVADIPYTEDVTKATDEVVKNEEKEADTKPDEKKNSK